MENIEGHDKPQGSFFGDTSPPPPLFSDDTAQSFIISGFRNDCAFGESIQIQS